MSSDEGADSELELVSFRKIFTAKDLLSEAEDAVLHAALPASKNEILRVIPLHDGALIATLCSEGVVRINRNNDLVAFHEWNATILSVFDKDILLVFEKEKNRFRCCQISTDGKGCEELYNEAIFTVITDVIALNNSHIALGDSSGNLTILKRNQPRAGKPVSFSDHFVWIDVHEEAILCMACHANLVITGSEDCTVQIYDFTEPKKEDAFIASLAHDTSITSVTCTDKYVISSSAAFNVKVWCNNGRGFPIRHSFANMHVKGAISSLMVVGDMILSADKDGYLLFAHIAQEKAKAVTKVTTASSINDMALLPRGKIAIGGIGANQSGGTASIINPPPDVAAAVAAQSGILYPQQGSRAGRRRSISKITLRKKKRNTNLDGHASDDAPPRAVPRKRLGKRKRLVVQDSSEDDDMAAAKKQKPNAPPPLPRANSTDSQSTDSASFYPPFSGNTNTNEPAPTEAERKTSPGDLFDSLSSDRPLPEGDTNTSVPPDGNNQSPHPHPQVNSVAQATPISTRAHNNSDHQCPHPPIQVNVSSANPAVGNAAVPPLHPSRSSDSLASIGSEPPPTANPTAFLHQSQSSDSNSLSSMSSDPLLREGTINVIVNTLVPPDARLDDDDSQSLPQPQRNAGDMILSSNGVNEEDGADDDSPDEEDGEGCSYLPTILNRSHAPPRDGDDQPSAKRLKTSDRHNPNTERSDGQDDGDATGPIFSSLYVQHTAMKESFLFRTFKEFGEIISVYVPVGTHGVGFVNFDNPLSAQTAMAEMDKKELEGNKLRVRPAKNSNNKKADKKRARSPSPERLLHPQQLRDGNGDRELRKTTSRLIIKGMDNSCCNQQWVREHFACFGTIASVRINSMKGSAIIRFKSYNSEQNAIACLNGKEVGGRKLYINRVLNKSDLRAESSKPNPPGPQSDLGAAPAECEPHKPHTGIFVKSLSSALCNTKGVRDLFSRFGAIKNFNVLKNEDGSVLGYAVIRFHSYDAQEKALAEMHGKEIDGQILDVTRFRSKAERLAEKRARLMSPPSRPRSSEPSHGHRARSISPDRRENVPRPDLDSRRSLHIRNVHRDPTRALGHVDMHGERESHKPPTGLYIGQLGNAVWHEEELRGLFSRFGAISYVRLLYNPDKTAKGTAIIQFKSHVSEQAALTEMNGKDIGGRILYVNRFKTKREREAEKRSRPMTPRRRSITPEWSFAHRSRPMSPERRDGHHVHAPRPDPVDKRYLHDRNSEHMRYADTSDRHGGREPGNPLTGIYIDQIHQYCCSQEGVRELFSRFGYITQVRILLNVDKSVKGSAILRFTSYASEQMAIDKMNGKEVHGRILHVNRVKSKWERDADKERARTPRPMSPYRRTRHHSPEYHRDGHHERGRRLDLDIRPYQHHGNTRGHSRSPEHSRYLAPAFHERYDHRRQSYPEQCTHQDRGGYREVGSDLRRDERDYRNVGGRRSRFGALDDRSEKRRRTSYYL